MTPCALLVILCVVPSALGRPQFKLTVVDDPVTPERTRPPSKTDLEGRRQALINALSPAAILGGATGQASSLQDLGLDLVGGILNNSASVIRPLTDATRKAKQNLPRVGDVINNVADSARGYRKQVGTGIRDSLSTFVNNAIRIFTTATARGSAVIGGVVKVFRTLIDNFTFSLASIARSISGGIQRTISSGTKFVTTKVNRARAFVQSPRLLQPVRDVTNLKVGLVRGIASDLSNVQPWTQEIFQSKLNLGAKLIPRVSLSNILGGVAEPEGQASGYSIKREYLSSSKEEGAPQLEALFPDEDPLSPESSNLAESKSTQVVTSSTSVPSTTETNTTSTTVPSTTEATTASTTVPSTTEATTASTAVPITTEATTASTTVPSTTEATTASTTVPSTTTEAPTSSTTTAASTSSTTAATTTASTSSTTAATTTASTSSTPVPSTSATSASTSATKEPSSSKSEAERDSALASLFGLDS